MKSFEVLKQLIESGADDALKFSEKGNAQAGKRLRKVMMDIKKQAQVVRTEVSEIKNAPKA